MTSSTEASRAARSAPRGASKLSPALAIVFFARTMRWAIVASLARKARAISSVARPPMTRSVSAARASADRMGWQAVKMRPSSSSPGSLLAAVSMTSAAPSCSASSARAICSCLRRRILSRRIASMARRLAAVISQAPGLAGTPVLGHSDRAMTRASCASSSARSTLRTTRTRPAMSLARSMRKIASIARCVLPAVMPPCRPEPQGRQAVRGRASQAPPSFARLRPCISVISGVRLSAKSAIVLSGRISISLGPGMGLGQRFTQATASSMSLTSQSQKPATSSRVSANGPSITVRPGPSNATRLPREEGVSPSAARRMPALLSSSLNLPIAAIILVIQAGSLAPLSLSSVAFTSTITRIVHLLVWAASSAWRRNDERVLGNRHRPADYFLDRDRQGGLDAGGVVDHPLAPEAPAAAVADDHVMIAAGLIDDRLPELAGVDHQVAGAHVDHAVGGGEGEARDEVAIDHRLEDVGVAQGDDPVAQHGLAVAMDHRRGQA